MDLPRPEPAEGDKSLPYLAPGVIDIQVNGNLSVDFSEPGLTVEGIRKATQGLWKVVVTPDFPTVVTSPYEVLKENFAVLARALNDPDIACSIPGFHLEGPYISPVDGFRGAHYKPFVRPPDWEEFVKINRAAGDRIMEVSLAPEIEGAMEFIRKCAQHGILVGLAHHNGSAEQIREAVDLGAVISTHLGNGCANTIHRHNNPLWPQLADDRLMASVIVDGFHLTRDEVRTFFKVKGKDRLILPSDVTNLAGMPPGEYQFNEQKVEMTPDA